MSTISRAEAARLVLDHVRQEFSGCGEIAINERYVIEDEDAWVFPYNTRAFLDSGDVMQGLISNNPVLVCKRTGRLHIYPAALSSRKMLEAFAAGDEGQNPE